MYLREIHNDDFIYIYIFLKSKPKVTFPSLFAPAGAFAPDCEDTARSVMRLSPLQLATTTTA